ncbi:phosphotransferase [Acetatifactor muris]|uniref:Choline/ethanolamine kinase n=1 Tax=Acetatifactor muris TaxID=879566 RepID=A0A2K4ZG85_9FIRM|nr:choline/ethanolamine kinase family protein [Acetatifactor muris]MCR2045733.1 phosphotransferase [Acetatifactor muris]SOY29471.1 Choline/ethanolamine kinase [Acetatifactor muris]
MAKEVIDKDLPKVANLCREVLGESFIQIWRLGGNTNRTYHVVLGDENEYVIRIPGEGTEELIVRKNENVSTALANKLNIDARLLHFGEDGAKVSEYIMGAITMFPGELQKESRIVQMTELLKRLHTCGEDTGIYFEVFDMAAGYERIITENEVPMYNDYLQIKSTVMDIKKEVDAVCEIIRVPCHNDALCENWVVDGNGRMYLIDWEYAGMNDAMWDLADVSIEAGYNSETDEKLLHCYFDGVVTDSIRKHFLASKIYVDYLWTLWAKARVPYDGQPMEDWAVERYIRLKKNIEEYFKYKSEEELSL